MSPGNTFSARLCLRLAAAFVLGIGSCGAVEISLVGTDSGITLVTVSGYINPGDEREFDRVTADLRYAAIIFESPGGSLVSGLGMGRTIAAKGFSTAVAADAVCASACALAWLGGRERFMTASSLVGFHAAYTGDGATARESGLGNALIGAYVNQLGLSQDAIAFIVSAPPSTVSWLTVADAKRLGIPVAILSEDGSGFRHVAREGDEAEPVPERPNASLPLKLPPGFRWIVIKSAPASQPFNTAEFRRLDASLGQNGIRVVSTRNGMQAAVIGPMATRDAEAALEMLSDGNWIPPDSYLSSGNGFVELLR